MSITLYGIPNCDTVKKARTWLTTQGRDYVFHDLKKNPVPQAQMAAWLEQESWEVLLNRKGTTWRALDESVRAAVNDAQAALALMQAQPSIIKRPVLEVDGKLLAVGFAPERYQALFPT